MTNEELIYQCMLDKTYQNKTELELILNRVSDNRLIYGFLSDLFSNHKSYNIDESIPLELFSQYKQNMKNISAEQLVLDNQYYKNKMSLVGYQRKSYTSILIQLLSSIIISDMVEFENLLKITEKPQLLKIKEYFLEKEKYEYIIYIDKYL